MTEKPLHVQVAEALGWTNSEGNKDGDYWEALPPQDGSAHYLFAEDCWPRASYEESQETLVPHYDTDWSATGPLIEKYELALGQTGMDDPKPTWVAWWPGFCDIDTCSVDEPADTTLQAVCHLILALKAAGKL